MPKGQKTPVEIIYKIMASYAVSGSYKETARELNLPVSTVKDIVDKNINKPEFVKLRNEKKADFAKRASEIIDKGMVLLSRRLERAIQQEEALDILIAEIFATDKEELTQDEKNKLVTKIRALQLQDIKALTTAVGTLYDKRALAKGESTENKTVNIKLPEGFEEYAG